MKFTARLLLPVFAGVALAASEPSRIFILSGPKQQAQANTPTLTPEEARLVLAQRLDVTQYHSLDGASQDTIAYINEFGGARHELFVNQEHDHAPSQLVLFLEGVTSKTLQSLTNKWGAVEPEFLVENQPSSAATAQLVNDLKLQMSPSQVSKSCRLADELHPFSDCWTGKSKILSLDLKKNEDAFSQLLEAQDDLLQYVAKDLLEVLLVAIPEANRHSKTDAHPYGNYEMPQKGKLMWRKIEEEPMSGPSSGASKGSKSYQASQSAPTGIIPICHVSEDACNSATNNCSGHGSCFLKYGSTGEEGRACFTCGCIPTVIESDFGQNTIYWGGPACSKQDISGQFWLLAGFSVILVGIVGWAISMLFAVGQEKLPGVIGAGVSGPKAR